MRSSDSPLCCSPLDFWPSFWVSSLSYLTRPLSYHQETYRMLQSLCGARYVLYKGIICFNWPKTDIFFKAQYVSCVYHQSFPVLDVCTVLRNSVHRRRTILTVPWMVEFLSMLDYIGPLLPCYRTALCLLLQIYKQV